MNWKRRQAAIIRNVWLLLASGIWLIWSVLAFITIISFVCLFVWHPQAAARTELAGITCQLICALYISCSSDMFKKYGYEARKKWFELEASDDVCRGARERGRSRASRRHVRNRE